MALDINQFKFFNDWNGREAGDFVLAKIGRFLVNHELADDWVCGYLGQDDFCALMPHSNAAVKELYAAVADIIESFESSMSFAPMLGVCMVEETVGVLDMLDRAKIALSEAKRDFKHRIRYFKPEMFAQTDAEYRLLTDFQYALADDEIYFALQPQCRLSSGQIVGAEGVETADKVEFLRSIGCRYVQGYHFYRPMTCSDFERLMADESLIDRSGFVVKPNEEFRLRELLDQNVYSDSMLNNILGPVCICSWKDDDVDVIRFNEQFYEELGVEHLEVLADNPENIHDASCLALDITLDNGSVAQTTLTSYAVQSDRLVFSYVLVLQMR